MNFNTACFDSECYLINALHLYTACEVGLEQPAYTVGEANVMQEVCLIKTNNAVLSENIDVQVFTSTLAANGVKGSATGT